ncbi:MAG: hypothetical protein ABSE73_04590 [Planctomycetota bacterium]
MRKPMQPLAVWMLAMSGMLFAGEAVKKEVVYDGANIGENAKGWASATAPSKATVAAQEMEVRTAGKKTMQFQAQGKDWMGMGWNWFGWWPEDSGTDISNHKNLSFWAKVTGEKKPAQLTVGLTSNDKKKSETADLLKYCPELLDGKWHELVVPIKDLDTKNELTKAKVWEIDFGTWSQDEINFSLFVDEIGFDSRG